MLCIAIIRIPWICIEIKIENVMLKEKNPHLLIVRFLDYCILVGNNHAEILEQERIQPKKMSFFLVETYQVPQINVKSKE